MDQGWQRAHVRCFWRSGAGEAGLRWFGHVVQRRDSDGMGGKMLGLERSKRKKQKGYVHVCFVFVFVFFPTAAVHAQARRAHALTASDPDI